MSAYSVGDFLEQHHAFTPWSSAPARECRSGGRDRPLNVLATSLLELTQQDSRVDRTSVVELTGCLDRLTSDHHRIALAKARPNLFDCVVQLAVQILHSISGHRGVGDFGGHKDSTAQGSRFKVQGSGFGSNVQGSTFRSDFRVTS